MGVEIKTCNLHIRPAIPDDLPSLLDLYRHLTPNNKPFPTAEAEEIFGRFTSYRGSAIFLGQRGQALVTSCVLVVIPNLTRFGQPYALIENVVTHAAHRRQGHGKAILDAACAQAWAHRCYKVMLMTGASDRGTLRFYENAGFAQSKTGFQKRAQPGGC